ncbi:MAG: TFIIB-type zinc ribbon-containing protein [Planctomycetota bacterium]
MEVPCSGCGAILRLNVKLAGMTVSCPQCGAKLVVPRGAPPPAPEPAPKLQLPARFTLWLLGAQLALAALGLSCLAGAFFGQEWNPPTWSYFHEPPMLLVVFGIVLVVAGWLAHYLPILTTLGVVLLVMGACALHYATDREVDASRTLALSLALLALWLSFQHRRALTR